MMKMMPKGKGLRKALKRIQKAKLKQNVKKVKKADTSMLTKSARRMIRKEEFKKAMSSKVAKKNPTANKDIRKVKKVEKSKLKHTSTKTEFGKKAKLILRKVITAKKPSKQTIKKMRRDTNKAMARLGKLKKAGNTSTNSGVRRGTKKGKSTQVYELSY